MPQVTITIDIADEPLEGYQQGKLNSIFGDSGGEIAGRIVRANTEKFDSHRVKPVGVLAATIVQAVQAAEA